MLNLQFRAGRHQFWMPTFGRKSEYKVHNRIKESSEIGYEGNHAKSNVGKGI